MLSKKSLAQLEQVKKFILDNHVTSFQTRAALDRLIERIKFPYVRKLEEMYGTINRTYYKNQQYDPIRNELVDSGFLSMKRVSNRCEFTVIGGKEREAFNKFMGMPVQQIDSIIKAVYRYQPTPMYNERELAIIAKAYAQVVIDDTAGLITFEEFFKPYKHIA